MEQNPLYSKYAAQFAVASLPSLVKSFNSQVGNRGWNSARAAHDAALVDELRRRGIDLSAIKTDHGVSFANKVKLNDDATALLLN